MVLFFISLFFFFFKTQGLRPPDQEAKKRKKDDFQKEEKEKDDFIDTYGNPDNEMYVPMGWVESGNPQDTNGDSQVYDDMPMGWTGAPVYQDEKGMDKEPMDVHYANRRRRHLLSGSFMEHSHIGRRLLEPDDDGVAPVMEPPKDDGTAAPVMEPPKDDGTGGAAAPVAPVVPSPPKDGGSSRPDGKRKKIPSDRMSAIRKKKGMKTSDGIRRLPDFKDAPSSYSLTENDIRASFPYSIDEKTKQPRTSGKSLKF